MTSIRYKFILLLVGLILLVGVSSATTVETFYADTNADGRITNETNQNYYITRVSEGSAITNTSYLITVTGISFTSTSNNTDSLVRFFIGFNTSSIPDNATITSAIFSIESESGGQSGAGKLNVGITGFAPTLNTTLQLTDYNSFGNTSYSDTYIGWDAWELAGNQNFTLNAAGLANVSKTAYTPIMVRIKDDILGTATEFTDTSSAYTTFKGYESSISDVTMKPFLEVTYEYGEIPTTAAFSANVTSGSTPLAVGFTDASTATPTDWDWYWYANETKSSDSQNPTTTLTTGTYNVRLWASNTYGGDWENKTAYIVVGGGGVTPDTVSFTANQTTCTPACTVSFVDTSTIGGTISGRRWGYKDYSGYTTDGYTATPAPVLNFFSNTNSVNPTYAWGTGNWSITLNVTNGTGPYNSAVNYLWVNVSSGSLGGSIPGTYRMYPADNIWNVPKDTLPVDSHSAAWIAGLDYNSVNDRIGYYISPLGVQGVSVNTSNTARQSVVGGSNYYNDYNPVPIPDDFIVESASSGGWSDKHGFIVDTTNGLSYEMYAMEKNANGTWRGSPSIWNTTNNLYRFYPNTLLGENYYYTYPTVLRTNRTPTWAGGMSGQPQSAGMVRYEEVATGYVNHSLFLSGSSLNGTAIWPAVSSGYWTPEHSPGDHVNAAPAGAIIRLKNTTDISWMDPQSKVIAQALKTYGGILSENVCTDATCPYGNSFNVIGYYSPSWHSSDLGDLLLIGSSNFEIVNAESLIPASTTCINADTVSGLPGYHICYSMQASGVPISDFSASPISGSSPLSLSFYDASSFSPTNWDWYWYANETKSSDLQNPTATLTTGTYNVRLYTSNAYGSDWENKTAYVTVTDTTCAPVANFTATPLSGDVPLTVTFTDTSTCYPTAWYWVYGLGTFMSSEQNPTHTFTIPGVYAIGLVAYNDAGWNSELKGNYINATEPSTPVPTPTPTDVPITPTPTVTTVAPTPIPTFTGTGPQIDGYSSLTSNGVNFSITSSTVTGNDVWIIYGQNKGGYTWITQNVTKTSTTTYLALQGSPLFGNTAYWARACDGSGNCGNEVPFSTAAITPMPTTTFGYGFRQIVGMR